MATTSPVSTKVWKTSVCGREGAALYRLCVREYTGGDEKNGEA
jgi:hypothetical protein